MYYVEGEVHKQLPNGAYRVKAKVLDAPLAMYINGIVVFPPSDKHPDWTVYTPKAGNARIIEFANSSTLWQEIQEACIDAVKLEMSYEQANEIVDLDQSDDKTDEQLKNDLNNLFPD
jgi:hypothetical protein